MKTVIDRHGLKQACPFLEWTKDTYRRILIRYKEPNEAGLPPTITPATDSTNLVYFHGDLVIVREQVADDYLFNLIQKFYTKAGIRESSFEKERDIYHQLQENTACPQSFPVTKASGTYTDAEGKEWYVSIYCDCEAELSLFVRLPAVTLSLSAI